MHKVFRIAAAVPVLKVGGRYKVRRVDLLSFLGLAGE